MLPLAFLIVVILLAVAFRLAVPGWRRLRARAELRGDWWSRFERDFRHYTGAWQAARDGERPTP